MGAARLNIEILERVMENLMDLGGLMLHFSCDSPSFLIFRIYINYVDSREAARHRNLINLLLRSLVTARRKRKAEWKKKKRRKKKKKGGGRGKEKERNHQMCQKGRNNPSPFSEGLDFGSGEGMTSPCAAHGFWCERERVGFGARQEELNTSHRSTAAPKNLPRE